MFRILWGLQALEKGAHRSTMEDGGDVEKECYECPVSYGPNVSINSLPLRKDGVSHEYINNNNGTDPSLHVALSTWKRQTSRTKTKSASSKSKPHLGKRSPQWDMEIDEISGGKKNKQVETGCDETNSSQIDAFISACPTAGPSSQACRTQ